MKPVKPVATIIKSIIDLFIYFNCLFRFSINAFCVFLFVFSKNTILELNGLIWEYE